MTKTRTYLKDGKVVTSTITKLVVSGEENKVREEHNIRLVYCDMAHQLIAYCTYHVHVFLSTGK